MKRIVAFLFIMFTACMIYAQNGKETTGDRNRQEEKTNSEEQTPTDKENGIDETPNDSLMLKEITVTSERTRSTSDALRLTPTAKQKETSSTGYGLLSKLALPVVKVDEVMQTISVPGNMGAVQVRINDIIATKQDLIALDMNTVRHVDFMENPGLRYGKDVNYVINIITRKAENGYNIGASLMNSVNTVEGNNSIFAKFNNKRSELAISYSFGYSDTKKQRYEETAEYLMPDNSLRTIQRKDIENREKSFGHDIQLKYSLTDTGRYVLQAILGGNISDSPDNKTRRMNTGNEGDDMTDISSSDRSLSPTIDIYFNGKLSKQQSITANITGTYVCSDYSYLYDGNSPYSYTAEGKSRSLFNECIYENRMHPFTLSSGLQYNLKYVSNRYSGDTEASNDMHSSDLYTFAQIKGRLSSLSYTAGMGISRRYYSQGMQRYEYWLWRPELSLSLPFFKQFILKYNITVDQRPPRLEYLGDVAIRINETEISVGNPALRPARVINQSLNVSYQIPTFYTQIETAYRRNLHCVMAYTDRVTGNDGNTYFISGRSNHRKINMFYIDNYTRWDIMPDKLSLTAEGGIYRCLNYGNDYKHHYSAFNWSTGLTAYLGKLTLGAYADNGWNFLEGETKVRQSDSYRLNATYNMGSLSISLHWQHCLENNVRMYRGELLNRYIHKTQSITSGDAGNMVSLSLTWKLSKGHEYNRIKRGNSRKDTDTGIKRSAVI